MMLFSKKTILIFNFLGAFIALHAFAQGSKIYTTYFTPITIKKGITPATLKLEFPLQLKTGVGLRLSISKWVSEGPVEIYTIGPKGETLPIIQKEKGIKTDPQGEATFDIPYAFKGFYEGVWVFVVAGPSGIYQNQISIPQYQ